MSYPKCAIQSASLEQFMSDQERILLNDETPHCRNGERSAILVYKPWICFISG